MTINRELTVTKSIQIKAARMKVWAALTTPPTIRQYLYGAETITDWKVGSPIVFQGEVQGQKWQDKGTILEIQLGQLLRYSYWSGYCGMEDLPENYAMVTYRLESKAGGTLLTITQEGYASEESRQSSENGWKSILHKIKEIVEAAWR
jgi:uncharacterized protein YndB with AHSA1/START domain